MSLESLNAEQRAAAEAGDGASLVIAGAGTGKTRTLVHRVAVLIERGVAPEHIVLLTFTRRAAKEMLERVAELVGDKARRVRGGTFHGFAQIELRRHAARIGHTSGFTITDSDDAERLVGEARTLLGFAAKGSGFPQKSTVAKVLSKHRNTRISIKEVLADEYPQHLPLAAGFEAIHDAYQKIKRDRDVMDYDDLLVHLADVLRIPEVALAVGQHIHHVLVDEYQDTNILQADIASLLAVRHGNLMVVGDEAQSIYGFRGATVENILSFPDDHDGAPVYLLQQNYRSYQPILDLANAVLDSSTRGFDKRLFTDKPDGEKPQLVHVDDEEDQAEYVATRIEAHLKAGGRPQDVAVLFRSASHSNFVEIALTRRNISFRKYGGIRFAEAGHVKDVGALLRVALNPKDTPAWRRCLEWIDGVGEKTALAITLHIVDTGKLDPEVWAKKAFADPLRQLAATVDAIAGSTSAVGSFIQAMEYYKTVGEKRYDDFPRRIKDLETLHALAQSAPDLASLLADLALDPGETDDLTEPLVLSTIHSAKGLEWPTVFVLSLIDGGFPSAWSMDSDEKLDEERRLFYVAVTRAREQLVLMRPNWVRASAIAGNGSALLDEMPKLKTLVRRGEEVAKPVDTELDAAKARMDKLLERFKKR